MAGWLAMVVVSVALLAQEWKRVAPWSGLRWRSEVAEVKVGESWYELVAVDGNAASDLIAHARAKWGERGKERFTEDLYEVMETSGNPPGATVDLDLVDLATRKAVRREDVAMDAATRRELMRSLRDPAADAEAAARRALRDRDASAPAATLARADALADLEWLAAELRGGYSYWFRGGEAFERRRAELAAKLPAAVTTADLARDVQELLSLLGDGHTQVDGFDAFVPQAWMPFLVEETGGKFVALAPDRGGFVDDDARELVALDGRPLVEWFAAAKRWVARGPAAGEQREAMRGLRRLAFLRAAMGLPASPTVKATLADARGKRREVELPVSSRKPTYGIWPRAETRRLEGGAGYLRIESMADDPAFLAQLRSDLDGFADAPGLVIDVRGNGGGSRAALRELLPRLMEEGEALAIVNVAARRIVAGEPPDSPDGSLDDRFLFPATARCWSDAERPLVERFLAKWKPSAALPKGDFTAWHVMGVGAALPAGAKRLSGPVVVLQDGGCFSATDVFLAALKGRRGVTTVGTTSGGGSGRARRLALPRSGLELRASTMASFRPDGSAYDGVGIAPDVVVEPAAEDFVGRGDAQLDAALRELEKRRKGKR